MVRRKGKWKWKKEAKQERRREGKRRKEGRKKERRREREGRRREEGKEKEGRKEKESKNLKTSRDSIRDSMRKQGSSKAPAAEIGCRGNVPHPGSRDPLPLQQDLPAEDAEG